MDTRDGSMHRFRGGTEDNALFESQAEYLKRTNGKPSDLVPVEGEPVPDCTKCKGTGRVRKGMFSRRWKPCKCTYTDQDHKQAGFEAEELDIKHGGIDYDTGDTRLGIERK